MGFSLHLHLFDIGRLVLASASPRRRELVNLLDLSLPVLVFSTDVDESVPSDWSPGDAAPHLALRKARAAVTMLDDKPDGRSVIIGADTIVALDGEMMGKPENENDAVRMLGKLQGRSHEVYTGVACIAAVPESRSEPIVPNKAGSSAADRMNIAHISESSLFSESHPNLEKPFYRTKHARFFLREERDVETGCILYASVGYSVSQVRFKRLDLAEIERYVRTGEPMDKAGAYGLQGRGAALIEHIEGDHNGIIGLPISLLAEMLKVYGLSAF